MFKVDSEAMSIHNNDKTKRKKGYGVLMIHNPFMHMTKPIAYKQHFYSCASSQSHSEAFNILDVNEFVYMLTMFCIQLIQYCFQSLANEIEIYRRHHILL